MKGERKRHQTKMKKSDTSHEEQNRDISSGFLQVRLDEGESVVKAIATRPKVVDE